MGIVSLSWVFRQAVAIGLAVCLALAISLGTTGVIGPVAFGQPQTQPKRQPAEESTAEPVTKTFASETAPDPLVAEMEALVWKPAPEEASQLSYEAALTRTIGMNLDILLSDEKIKETEAKQDEVESKRALLFFKYLNADDIEGSAESDVMAAKAHNKTVVNEALKTTSQYYFDAMRSVMASYIAHQAIRKGLKQLQYNQSQFAAGEATSFEVMQTKTQLVQRYQEYLDASLTQESAGLRLSRYLGMEGAAVSPSALRFEADTFRIEPFALVDDALTESAAVATATQKRPELAELDHRRTAIDNLVEAYAKKFDKVHVAIMKSIQRQLVLRREKARHSIETTAAKAYQEFRLAHKKLELANRQLDLATTALRQAQISNQAGFSSNKDVLDAQVAFAQAQVNQANTLIDFNMSQVTLLYETGEISAHKLLGQPEPAVAPTKKKRD